MSETASDARLFSSEHETLFSEADAETFVRLVHLIETINDARDAGNHEYASELIETYLRDYPIELVRTAQEYLKFEQQLRETDLVQ